MIDTRSSLSLSQDNLLSLPLDHYEEYGTAKYRLSEAISDFLFKMNFQDLSSQKETFFLSLSLDCNYH